MRKPLGIKAYGSIPHLPESRMGPGDHHVHPGQAAIATVKTRDRYDIVRVQEKLDGSNVAIANVDGKICALGRSGYLAQSSPHVQHQLFAAWVREREDVFAGILSDGERLCGEWLAQAHGTRYDLAGREPFVVFDLMRGAIRVPYDIFTERVAPYCALPRLIFEGRGACRVVYALEQLGCYGHYGARDVAEGCVWRVEHKGTVDFLCKYVRPDKIDGCYLPNVTGGEPVWNWRPIRLASFP